MTSLVGAGPFGFSTAASAIGLRLPAAGAPRAPELVSSSGFVLYDAAARPDGGSPDRSLAAQSGCL